VSKRLCDTDIWKKTWFRKLKPEDKLAFRYVLENCDYVGVWEPDLEAANFHIGAKIDWNGLIDKVNGNIIILPNRKWFLIDYCKFQYGALNPESNSDLIQNVIKRLKKHGLWDEENQCISVYYNNSHNPGSERKSTLHLTLPPTLDLGYKEKEKEKEKKKEKEKEKEARAGPRVENKIPISEKAQQLLEYYKKITGKLKVKKIPEEVTARLKEGHSVEEGKKVILYKFLRWWDDPNMRECVNLTTLFRPSHFEEYLSQAEQGLDLLLQESYINFKKQFIDEHMNEPREVRQKLKIPTLDQFRTNFLGGFGLDEGQEARSSPS
jgi:uncharacterized phage protein (TIGR02220 family)